MVELSVISLSLNSMDTLSGVTDRLFCMLFLVDIELLTDILLTLEPEVLPDLLLVVERGRGMGIGTLLLTVK